MREIKFRGRKPNGEWVYGDLVTTETTNGIPTKKEILPFDSAYIDDAEYVEQDTIGQFVGLRDKHGKEIYEGDIIDFYSAFWRELEYPNKIDPKHFYRLVVVWNKRDVGFGLVSLREALLPPEAQSPSGITQISDSYLIGNIHDNPEMLSN